MIDPEILAGFREETQGLLGELVQIVEGLEDPQTGAASALTEFAQRIDRIMGAAKTLAQISPQDLLLPAIGAVTEICKSTGYEAARIGKGPLLPIFAAFWAEVLEIVAESLPLLDRPISEQRQILQTEFVRIQKRMTWLSNQVSTLAGKEGNSLQLSQAQIDQLTGLGK